MPSPNRTPLVGRDKELNTGAPDGFVRHRPIGLSVPPVILYAVIGTWYEADIIEATVKNCFANGVRKVFIVDNDSPDSTREVAQAAGAVIAKNYTTDFYDDDYRLRLMNEVMQQVTEEEKLPQLWWLSIDADEFPCGPNGQRLLDFLSMLHPDVNCVGANAIDLYPTERPFYTSGRHPADGMAMGHRRKGWDDWFCSSHHWKHPLLRQDGGIYTLAQSRGSHIPCMEMKLRTRGGQIIEPHSEIVLFHAPLRTKEAAYARLKALCTKQDALGGHHRSAGDDHHTGGNGAIKRWMSLEHIYNQEWDRVTLPHSQAHGRNIVGIALYPWRRLVPFAYFPRWY